MNSLTHNKGLGRWKARVFLASTIAAFISGATLSVVFAAARADWHHLNCHKWPEAGNCSDAVSVQWIAGGAAAIFFMTGMCALKGFLDARL